MSGKQASVTVLDSSDISVTLHFTENQPRDDVSVVVVSVVSRNYQPVTNYVLQAVAPKVRKVDVMSCSQFTCLYVFFSIQILMREGKNLESFFILCVYMYAREKYMDVK